MCLIRSLFFVNWNLLFSKNNHKWFAEWNYLFSRGKRSSDLSLFWYFHLTFWFCYLSLSWLGFRKLRYIWLWLVIFTQGIRLFLIVWRANFTLRISLISIFWLAKRTIHTARNRASIDLKNWWHKTVLWNGSNSFMFFQSQFQIFYFFVVPYLFLHGPYFSFNRNASFLLKRNLPFNCSHFHNLRRGIIGQNFKLGLNSLLRTIQSIQFELKLLVLLPSTKVLVI